MEDVKMRMRYYKNTFDEWMSYKISNYQTKVTDISCIWSVYTNRYKVSLAVTENRKGTRIDIIISKGRKAITVHTYVIDSKYEDAIMEKAFARYLITIDDVTGIETLD